MDTEAHLLYRETSIRLGILNRLGCTVEPRHAEKAFNAFGRDAEINIIPRAPSTTPLMG